MDEILKAAKQYLSEGYSIIPLDPVTKKNWIVKTNPITGGPVGFSWKKYQTKQPSLTLVKSWIKKYPGMTLGIIPKQNQAVIDIDKSEYFDTILDAYPELKKTAIQKTGKGYHIWVELSGNEDWSKKKYEDEKGKITWFSGLFKGEFFGEVKGNGSYLAVSPKTHINGNEYTWINPLSDINTVEKLADISIERKTKVKNKSTVLKTKTTTNKKSIIKEKVIDLEINDSKSDITTITFSGSFSKGQSNKYLINEGSIGFNKYKAFYPNALDSQIKYHWKQSILNASDNTSSVGTHVNCNDRLESTFHYLSSNYDPTKNRYLYEDMTQNGYVDNSNHLKRDEKDAIETMLDDEKFKYLLSLDYSTSKKYDDAMVLSKIFLSFILGTFEYSRLESKPFINLSKVLLNKIKDNHCPDINIDSYKVYVKVIQFISYKEILTISKEHSIKMRRAREYTINYDNLMLFKSNAIAYNVIQS